jgi:SAM-dependent methyltransferase
VNARPSPPRFDASRFDRQYQASEDPWNYGASDYEREKYERTLAALPDRPLGDVLELGCSIGVFTALLAPRCRRLVALDFSARALALAEPRVRRMPQVELVEASFPEAVPRGPWDAVICSEILYYLDAPLLGVAIDWLADQLRVGAHVVAVGWRGHGSDEPLQGDDVHDRLALELAAWHTLDGRHPAYRLDRFGADGG